MHLCLFYIFYTLSYSVIQLALKIPLTGQYVKRNVKVDEKPILTDIQTSAHNFLYV